MTDQPIWERMREAADTMEEARALLPKGYSPEYRFDIETLRSFADQFEHDAAVKLPLIELFKERTNSSPVYIEMAVAALLKQYDVKPKERPV